MAAKKTQRSREQVKLEWAERYYIEAQAVAKTLALYAANAKAAEGRAKIGLADARKAAKLKAPAVN